MPTNLKQYLPGSSRSLHAMHEELSVVHAELDQLKVLVEKLTKQNEQLLDELHAHDTHMKMFAWEQYRKENETLEEAKQRFFSSISPADSSLRLLQKSSLQLLREFDAFCKGNGIQYWLSYGTLLGAYRHHGFIPWDDDIDLGIMRNDLLKLEEALEGSERYKLTLKYDACVGCKQYRFMYKDEDLPCFVDLFPYDLTEHIDDLGRKASALHNQMYERIWGDEALKEWAKNLLCDSESPLAPRIEALFSEYQEQLKLTEPVENASAEILYGLDNWANKEEYDVYKFSDVFPLETLEFEATSLPVPHSYKVLLEEAYGDYMALPNDIATHVKHVDLEGLTANTREKLENLASSC